MRTWVAGLFLFHLNAFSQAESPDFIFWEAESASTCSPPLTLLGPEVWNQVLQSCLSEADASSAQETWGRLSNEARCDCLRRASSHPDRTKAILIYRSARANGDPEHLSKLDTALAEKWLGQKIYRAVKFDAGSPGKPRQGSDTLRAAADRSEHVVSRLQNTELLDTKNLLLIQSPSDSFLQAALAYKTTEKTNSSHSQGLLAPPPLPTNISYDWNMGFSRINVSRTPRHTDISAQIPGLTVSADTRSDTGIARLSFYWNPKQILKDNWVQEKLSALYSRWASMTERSSIENLPRFPTPETLAFQAARALFFGEQRSIEKRLGPIQVRFYGTMDLLENRKDSGIEADYQHGPLSTRVRTSPRGDLFVELMLTGNEKNLSVSVESYPHIGPSLSFRWNAPPDYIFFILRSAFDASVGRLLRIPGLRILDLVNSEK